MSISRLTNRRNRYFSRSILAAAGLFAFMGNSFGDGQCMADSPYYHRWLGVESRTAGLDRAHASEAARWSMVAGVSSETAPRRAESPAAPRLHRASASHSDSR